MRTRWQNACRTLGGEGGWDHLVTDFNWLKWVSNGFNGLLGWWIIPFY